MKRVAVVHLVRKRNGLDPLRRFLSSYRAFEAGMEHDLVLLLKGFRDGTELQPYRELMQGLPYRILEVPDRGYDIMAYWSASERLEHEWLFLLNSFSEVRVGGWLEKLHGAAGKGIGLVGATGSSQTLNPSPHQYYECCRAVSRKMHHRGPLKRLLMRLPFASDINVLRRRLQTRAYFGEFPNYHVRTNAFLVQSDLLRNALRQPVRTKMDAYRFESGRQSLTMQVLQAGMTVLVVGADGNRYEKEEWHLSNTFWQSRQQNLLVADNQTRHYEESSTDTRELLSALAWGVLARPT